MKVEMNMTTPISPLRVLIVENHADTRTYLCRYLEMKGHGVRSAESLRDALKSLAEESVDVVISDIGLPDGDGWKLFEDYQTTQRPFGIAMSGYGTSADRERSRMAGFRHHLTKPFDPEELDQLLRQAGDERRAQVEVVDS